MLSQTETESSEIEEGSQATHLHPRDLRWYELDRES